MTSLSVGASGTGAEVGVGSRRPYPPGERRAAAVASAIVGLIIAATLVGGAYTVPSAVPCTTCTLGEIPDGYGPVAETYDPATGDILVSDGGPGGFVAWGVTAINGSTETVAGHVTTTRPSEIAYDPLNADIYLTAFLGSNLTIVNPLTGTVVSTINESATSLGGGYYLGGLYSTGYDPATRTMIALDNDPSSLLIINASSNQLEDSYSLSTTGSGLALNPANGEAYLFTNASFFEGFNVTAVNGSTGLVLSSIALPGIPQTIAYDAENGLVYVGSQSLWPPNAYNGTVTILGDNGTRVLQTLAFGGQFPVSFAVDSALGSVYVAGTGGTMFIINGTTNQLDGAVPISLGPSQLTYDEQNRCLYVLYYTGNQDGNLTVLAPPGGTCAVPPSATESLLPWVVLGVGLLLTPFVVVAVAYSRPLRR
jgi:DNA-binding beta-propeller fold protein YncE